MRTAFPYLLAIFLLAVVLDILFVRGMQKYRRLKKEATHADGKLRISKFELIQLAFWGNTSRQNNIDHARTEVIRSQLALQISSFFVPTKRSLTTFLFSEGLIILLLGARVYNDLAPEHRYRVLWSVAVGAMMIVVGILTLWSKRANEKATGWLQQAGNWLSVLPLQVLLLITSPIFAFLTINAAGFQTKMWSPFAAIVTWLIGIGFAVIGAWNWTDKFPLPSRRTTFWFVTVTILAFLVRGIATDSIPILLTGDEASMGTNAVRYAKGEWDNLFITGWFSFPTLFYFLQSFSIRIFGESIEALRIPSAFAGALTVGTVYLCGKLMWGHRVGLFAALILASLHLHIHFSRLGLNNIWDGLWFTLTVAMLWYGWKTHTRWAYLLAGLSLGFSQYFYATSKALVGVIVVAALLAFFIRRVRFRQMLPDHCLMLLVALTIFIPLGWHYANAPSALLAPFARASMLKEIGSSGLSFWTFLSQQLPGSLGVYTHIPFMQQSFWYPAETPLLLPVAATFFLIGLAFLLFHHPDSRTTLLIVWLLFIALGNALSSITPVAQRYIAAAPVCALVAGYGLHKTAESLASLWLPLQRIFTAFAYILLGCIMVSDLWFYFVIYTPSSRLHEMTSNGMIAHQFGNFLHEQPAETQVVFFGVPHLSFNSPAILYLAPQIKGINAPEDWDSFDKSQLTSSKIIFVFRPEYRQNIEAVQKDYPEGRLTAETAWNGDVLYWVYEKDR